MGNTVLHKTRSEIIQSFNVGDKMLLDNEVFNITKRGNVSKFIMGMYFIKAVNECGNKFLYQEFGHNRQYFYKIVN